ncbi:glycosyltransferase involved in cell wall biosynthesis [Arcicella aurantiaca]|uniref:Glycosyltransferase involved in cell wall biosynthesis n=1 Tax=Arcicella aurantiaca TaxID=591202 RepID=A0A316DPN8_9BACT|nr:glycosyltransferase family 1 protein [Arcicella aurantiaca]PWK20041.1 glycosyltransferase involved in cell wall biosynthesis [Arcicella aurantiaca]
MRIGIEAQRLFRPHKHGMDIVALELIRALQVIDSENEYFIFVKPDEDRNCIQETRNFKIVEISGLNYVVWEQIMLPFYAQKYKLDILHCTSNTAPLYLPTSLVLTLHDVIFMEKSTQENTSTKYQKYGNLYRKWLVPKIVKKCKKIITISEVEKANIVKTLDLKEDGITVIHNGVSRRFGIKPSPEIVKEIRVRLGLTKDYFLFLGNVEPRKNVKNTVKAFVKFAEENPTVKLAITGLKEGFIVDILTEINKVALLDRFVLTGFVDDTSLLALYSEAKVFLYPSLREGFGLPILEAMSFGIPVVTSNISAMPEVAGDAAFMVNPYSVEEITEEMTIAYKNEGLRKEKITLGYARPSLFTWQKTASKVLSIYKLLKNR